MRMIQWMTYERKMFKDDFGNEERQSINGKEIER